MQLLKCCGIREKLENYDNIDLLGFNFIESSKRKIDIFKAKKILEDIQKKGYKKLKKIGLFDEKIGFEKILEILEKLKFDGVQYYSCNLENFKKLKSKGFFVIKPVNLDFGDFDKYKNFIDLFIIDGKNPGSGKSYDYSQINNLNLTQNFLVAGGISEKNVKDIFEIFKDNKYFCGVDVASGVDNGKNIDLEKLKKIVNKIKNYV